MRVYTYIYIYTHIHTCICIYTRIYIYTFVRELYRTMLPQLMFMHIHQLFRIPYTLF